MSVIQAVLSSAGSSVDNMSQLKAPAPPRSPLYGPGKENELPLDSPAEGEAAARKRKGLFPEWDQFLPVEERRAMPFQDMWLRGLRTFLPDLPATAQKLPRLTPEEFAQRCVDRHRWTAQRGRLADQCTQLLSV